jgi:cation-transporting P-type ATPase D
VAWSVPSVRWATGALALFLAGLTVQLLDGPAAAHWALYLACYAAGGWQPALDGLRALRERTLDVDLLMIVAAVAAASIGQITDGALLIVIFATSGALEELATARTEHSVRGLLNLTPDKAVLVDDSGGQRTVTAAELAIGDIVVVRPGDRLPADGEVVEGTSDVDQATITGEPLPAPKAKGDNVFAGTVNCSGALLVRVGREPSDTVVARIAALVSEASATKATTQLFIEKVERRYSVGVIVATMALLAVPMAFGADFEATLLRAMTFMIVASPCAVVLATMPPLLSAIANAGRHGVLIKSAVAMERLADTTVVAFDKTGTLTRGAPRLTVIHPLDAATSEQDVLRLAAAVEQYSEHPLGRAIAAAARDSTIPAATDFRAMPGLGVRGRAEGRLVEILGGGANHPAAQGVLDELRDTGATAVTLLADGAPLAVLGLRDEPRPGAAAAVAALGTRATPVLMTGDDARAAQHLAAAVGIDDVRAELLPERKAAEVNAIQSRGQRVLFVGDGVNDAPAMATAHSSIAMGRSGADLALEAADGVTVRDELDAVAAVVELARRARRVVIANLAIAASVIVILVVWDLVGHLPLPLGVAGHEGSTILVAVNGLRLLSERSWRRSVAGPRL